jgi:hypothetical protein
MTVIIMIVMIMKISIVKLNKMTEGVTNFNKNIMKVSIMTVYMITV